MIKNSTKLGSFLWVVVGSFISNTAHAQLSGNYTIGGVSGASNFASWADFASELNKNGVSGKTTVTVQSNLSVTAAVELKQHSSNNPTSTNTLTIDGNGYALSGSLSYEVLWLNGLDHTEIKNLKIVNGGTGAEIMGVRFSAGANNNTLNACTIEFSGNFSASRSGSAYVAFAASNSSPLSSTSQHNGIKNSIKSCTLTTTASASPGPTFAILNQQGSSAYSSSGSDNTFSGNSIRNFFSSAYYARYINGDQFVNNDVSRSAANSSSPVDTFISAANCLYGYSTNRHSAISSNNIHDLPFAGATTTSTNSVNRCYGVLFQSYNPSSNYGIVIEKNTIRNLVMIKSFRAISVDACGSISVLGNTIKDNEALDGGSSYGILVFNSGDVDITGNRIQREKMGASKAGNYAAIYLESVYNKNWGVNRVVENLVDSCISNETMYGLVVAWDGSWEVTRNRITFNRANGSKSVQVGTYFIYPLNLSLASNIIGNNHATAETYGIYNVNYYNGYMGIYRNNTVYIRNSETGHAAYGAYIEDESEVTFSGNIIDVVTSSTASPITLYSSTNFKEVNYNTFYTKNTSESWGIGSGSFSTFNGYRTSGSVGSSENFTNVNFKDPNKSDYNHSCFEAHNNVPYVAVSSPDISGVKRNASKHDRGALESVMDIEAFKVYYNLPSTICAGYESGAFITVKNNFTDTVYNFNVAYSVNGKVTRQLVSSKILPGDTLKVKFTVPIAIPIAVSTVVKIYVDAFDDKLGNDTFTFKTTVKSAPGGGKFEPSVKTSTPNNPTYLRAKPFDITVVDVPVIYDINPPRIYTNANYGATGKWVASFNAFTSAGKVVAGTSITAPISGRNLELQFKTSDTLLEDSTLFMVLKISDLVNGCDTFIRRQVLIAPRVVPGVKLPSKVCVGDTILFQNTSRIRSGYMTYWWDFGTGDPNDTTQESDPSFVFKKSGKYTVVLKGYSGLYGFVFSKVIPLTVNEIPVVDFTRSNACAGDKLVFVNNTTPKAAARYWDFGDGKGFVLNNADTVKITYALPGTYTVVLKADYLGCVSQNTQKAFAFVKPKADFDLKSGRCENALFEFSNKSTISSGTIGSKWFMNSYDSTTNELNGKWKFKPAASVWISLVVKSEFGCLDSIRKTFRVYDAPEANFTVDRACVLSGSKFTNSTPVVSEGVSNFQWIFSDGGSFTSANVNKSWTELGKKAAKLIVSVTNGCKDSVTREIDVLDQGVPLFEAANACSGDEVAFTNTSTIKSGNTITYSWDFGDKTTSTTESPKKRFFVKSTTTYFVTLRMQVAKGCVDSITQRVDIYEKPVTCDFEAIPDYSQFYWGLKVVPKDSFGVVGGQANVDYTFMISGVDTVYDKDAPAMALVNVGADGSYDVRMIATMRNGGDCGCDITKKMIVVDRLSSHQLAPSWNAALYPNPASTQVLIGMSGAETLRSIRILSVDGRVIQVLEGERLPMENGNWAFSVADYTPGIYWVKLESERGEKVLRLMKK